MQESQSLNIVRLWYEKHAILEYFQKLMQIGVGKKYPVPSKLNIMHICSGVFSNTSECSYAIRAMF